MQSTIRQCHDCQQRFTPETFKGHRKTERDGTVRCMTAEEMPWRKNYQQSRDGVWVALTGSRCACVECGGFFGSERLFRRHRTGSYAKAGESNTRRCLGAQEMTGNGWRINSRGLWTDASA
jgi:hypothetical protein